MMGDAESTRVQTTFWDFVNSGRRVVLAFLDPYADARTTEYKQWLCNTGYKNKKYASNIFGILGAEL